MKSKMLLCNEYPETEHTIYKALEDTLKDKDKFISQLIDKIMELEEMIIALEKEGENNA